MDAGTPVTRVLVVIFEQVCVCECVGKKKTCTHKTGYAITF